VADDVDDDQENAGNEPPSSRRDLTENVPAPEESVRVFRDTTPVPEATLPIKTEPEHRQWWFRNMTFLVIALLVALVVLATLITTAFVPSAGSLATDIAKSAIPALITLLGTAVTWAFRSGKE
jgi:hypothetical protein